MEKSIVLENILMENDIAFMEQPNTDDEISNSGYYKVIADTMGYIHSQIPEQTLNEKKIATEVVIRELNFRGKVEKCAVIYLLSNGCEWALKSANGCTMCGHLAKQTRKEDGISKNNLILQFEDACQQINFKKTPILYLYNNGSFLNDKEVDPEAREYILRRIQADPNIKMVVLESRPEFVQDDKIRRIKELVPDKYIEIAMGLEVKSDIYRAICINKGFTLQTYTDAVKIIKKYLHVRTYVFLKPPFLTERESIESAIETIRYVFEIGCDTVSLEACTIQDYTLVSYLFKRGMYQTPWLWSILEVVKQTWNCGKVIVGLFSFYPSPTGVPYNCDRCSNEFRKALIQYNRTLDIKAFEQMKQCNCKQEWKKELDKASDCEKIIQYLKKENEKRNCMVLNDLSVS